MIKKKFKTKTKPWISIEKMHGVLAKTMYWYEYWANKKTKNDFENGFLSWWVMQFLEKTMENVGKHRDTKHKKEEQRKKKNLISYQNQIMILEIFYQKLCWL